MYAARLCMIDDDDVTTAGGLPNTLFPDANHFVYVYYKDAEGQVEEDLTKILG